MGLETATYISQLVSSNPVHGDAVDQGDSHLRLIKAVLQAQFPNFTAAALVSSNAAIDALLAGPFSFASGGRLTLISATPFMGSTNTAGATTVYYTPGLSNLISIYSGSAWQLFTFAQTSVALDGTNFLSGALYDFFIWNNSGTPTLGYGPAWASSTARSAAIAIQSGGGWVNSGSITLRMSSSSTQVVAVGQATYVGTAYATANGQTAWTPVTAGAGGGAGVLGLYNTYNQLNVSAIEQDTTASWSIGATTTWRAADNNANNSITYVDGLGTVAVQALYQCIISARFTAIGVNRNSTSAQPTMQDMVFETTDVRRVAPIFAPSLGLNVLTAMECGASSATSTVFTTLSGALNSASGYNIGTTFATLTAQSQGLQITVEI